MLQDAVNVTLSISRMGINGYDSCSGISKF
ncbi:Uncharacterised protein [Klebsiella pneumoniae]|nr:hypothetical protein LT24_00254 [Klebsiella pneumoniae]CAH6367341.1 hypothetical protein AI2934V1_3840 [Klebsiella pneumoniae]SVZ86926.1 Uncharacterised protein [Klebsiella pneumoniae]SWS76736.1 Uncharacterised protein [Klebsiella pneumoniae]SWT09262.1 Uncharacterised protein [Klebsiella pneumoniae]